MNALTGQKIAKVTLKGKTKQQPLILTAGPEQVPPGETAGRFDGYPTIMHALTVASQLDSVGMIVQMRPKGRRNRQPRKFHVFGSDKAKHSVDPKQYSLVDEQTTRKFRSTIDTLRIVHLLKLDNTDSWAARMAKNPKQPHDYVSMLQDFMGLAPGEVFPETAIGSYRAGVVNFHLGKTDARGTTGFIVRGVNEWGSVRNGLKDRTKPLPEAVHVIGPMAFSSRDPLFPMMTIVHEFTHLAHHNRTLELINKWRAQKTDRSFSDWNYRFWKSETKRLKGTKGGKILARVDYAVTTDKTGIDSNNTHLTAPLEAFMIGYHHMPGSVFTDDEAFHQLTVLNKHWYNTQDGVLQVDTLDRLVNYTKALDKKRQAALVEWVTWQKTLVTQGKDKRIKKSLKKGAFYERFREAWAKKGP